MSDKIIYNSKRELAESKRLKRKGRSALDRGAAKTYARWAKEDAPKGRRKRAVKR